MVKLQHLDLYNWNSIVPTFHAESDRGAAILAGSFLENALGTFLIRGVADDKIGEKLFGPVGPLSSFSQRIAVAYAFRLITRERYLEFECIRQARNHFAHHPMDASFSSVEVQKHTAKLEMFKDQGISATGADRHRLTYLLTCGLLVASISDTAKYHKQAAEDLEFRMKKSSD